MIYFFFWSFNNQGVEFYSLDVTSTSSTSYPQNLGKRKTNIINNYDP